MQEKPTAQKTITYLEGDGSYTSAILPFSLNDADLTRDFLMTEGYFYYGTYQYPHRVNSGYTKEFTYASGATWYMLYDQIGDYVDSYMDMSVPQNTVYEIISYVDYPTGTVLDFTGTVLSSMGLGAGSVVPTKELIPDTLTLTVNGVPIGTPQPYLNGTFDVSGITYTSETDIYTIGFRFEYTTSKSESFWEVNWGYLGCSPYFKLIDSVTVTATPPEEDTPVYIPILTEIKDFLSDIYGVIVGLFTPDSGVIENSNQFVDDMTTVTDKIKEDVSEIDENTNRPPPEDLVPDITVIVDQSDENYISYMEGMSSLLASSTITNILLLMFSLAFCGYVLFGKKE